jgi:hypothetical protein
MCEMISQLLTLVRRVGRAPLIRRQVQYATDRNARCLLEDRSALAASGDALLARSDLDEVDRIVPWARPCTRRVRPP